VCCEFAGCGRRGWFACNGWDGGGRCAAFGVRFDVYLVSVVGVLVVLVRWV